jgi:hypothetical protein
MQTKTNENKYQNGKIYKITDNNFTECYIGSTIQKLAVRMGGHRRQYPKYLETRKGSDYLTSFVLFEKYGIENCQILLIEAFPCNSREELTAREAHHIKNTVCVNKRIEGRSTKQWIEDNKERYLALRRKYEKENKEKIAEAKRKAYDPIKQAQINKAYREAHRDELKAKKGEAFQCECGGSYVRSRRAHHMRTGKHTKFVAKTKTIEI